MGRTLPCVFVGLLLLLGGQASLAPVEARQEAGGAAPPSTSGRASEDVTWGPDLRLTTDASGDRNPSLFADSSGDFHLFWERFASKQMYMRLGDNGSVVLPERLITVASSSYQESGQRTPNIGIDDRQEVHVVWTTQGVYGPMYQKYDVNGWPKCQPINLAPSAKNPHVVSLAVGQKQRAYTVSEDEPEGRVEMSYVENNSGEYYLHWGLLAGKWGNGTTIAVDPAGYPHVLFRNATNGRLMHAKFDPEGQLLQNATSYLNQWFLGPDAPMPEIAFGPDGTMHILQAAWSWGPAHLYYAKLTNDGKALSGDMLLSNLSSSIGDLCVDRYGSVHIVFNNWTDGDLYYVRIPPDGGGEPMPAVRLTNTDGYVAGAVIAAGAGGGLGVAWFDNRDGGMGEIYFKAGLRPGVIIASEEEDREASLHLKETYRFPASVRNLGMAGDEVNLSINSSFGGVEGGIGPGYDGPGWKLWLDSPTARLGPREKRDLWVNVRAPSSGLDGENLTLRVSAVSGLDPDAWDDIVLRAGLSLTRRIDLNCTDDRREAPPDAAATFNLTIMSWDYFETVNLTMVRPPGWETFLSSSNLTLLPWEPKAVKLSVIPASFAKANTTGAVTVTAASVFAPNVTASVSVNVRVAPVLDLSIIPDPAESSVLPGRTAQYVLTVAKEGNVDNDTEVRLATGAVPEGWNATLNVSELRLRLSQTVLVGLSVQAPDKAFAGQRLPLLVEARDAGGGVLAACTVNTTVEAVHALEIEPEYSELEAYPGGTANAAVYLLNNGNGPETLLPGEPVLPVGWQVRLELPDGSEVGPGNPAVLRPGNLTKLRLVVYVSADSTAGRYFVNAVLRNAEGTGFDVTAFVDVLQVFNFSVGTDAPETSAAPGGTARFELFARNRGNGPENASLSLFGLPAGWRKPVFLAVDGGRADRFVAGPFSTVRVYLEVAVPGDFTGDSLDLAVRASASGGWTGSVGLRLRIMSVNIEIGNLEYEPAKPRPGQVVRFRMEITNTGDIDLEHVVFAVLDGNRTIFSRDLGRLDSGVGWVREFEWTASAGRHTLRFVADPLNATAEQFENDNSLEAAIVVEPGKSGGAAPWQLAVAGTVAVLAGVVALALVLRRRRGREAGKARRRSR
jgi:uncharacterized membrane protein